MAKKGKDLPTGPTRAPMEVGLSRHQPKPQAPPGWMEEYAGLVGVMAVVLVLVLGSFLVSALTPPPPPPPPAQMAVTYGPAKVWAEGSGSQLKTVSVKARNIAGVAAHGVKVFFELTGRRYPLEGPAEVAAGEEREYSGQINVRTSAEEKGGVVIECDNCRG